jgi:hypothetical protein
VPTGTALMSSKSHEMGVCMLIFMLFNLRLSSLTTLKYSSQNKIVLKK